MAEDGAEVIAQLEERCLENAGAYVALAEVHRRRGDGEAAERAAREAIARRPECAQARAILSLVLFDQGRLDESRQELVVAAGAALSQHTSTSPGGSGVTDRELDRAFAAAEPDADQVVDADRIAQEVLRETDTEPETPGVAGSPPSTFATRTMADLLASQGDAAGASRIRAALGAGGEAVESSWDWGQPGAKDPDAQERHGEALAVLERWLENLRGGRT